MGVASLVLGIIGLFGIIPIVGWFLIIFNILAVLLGFIAIMQKDNKKSDRNMAIAGIIMGAIPIVLKVVTWLFIILLSLAESGTY